MRKTFLLILLTTSITINTQAFSNIFQSQKEGYKITGTIKGLNEPTVMLAYYFGGKQYAKDTADVINGKFTFKGVEKLKGGMYLVVLSENKYLDIIISEQNFSFSTEIDNLHGAISFKNSKENPPFYEYLNFISKMQLKVTPLRKELETASGNKKKELEQKTREIDANVKSYQADFIAKHSNKFFTKLIKANTEIEIPKAPLDSTGKPEKNFPFYFYKKHFWDNIDFSDSRMLRTRVFYNKIDQYFEKLTVKHPDSIIISADILVEKSRANSDIFQYVVNYITSNYERSKIMGMDAVFVHMVEKYYITNQCNWVDSLQLVKIADRAQKIAPNLIGRKASEFLDIYGRPFMKDTLGITHTLQEIKAEYTILVFFGPTCGHCKKEMPKIKHNVDSLVNSGYDIKTFAVATEFDKKEWKKFIQEQKTGDWINVADINHDDEGNPVASSDWRDKYDIYSTPVVYLLDKEKKIIAKRITHSQIVDIIERRKK